MQFRVPVIFFIPLLNLLEFLPDLVHRFEFVVSPFDSFCSETEKELTRVVDQVKYLIRAGVLEQAQAAQQAAGVQKQINAKQEQLMLITEKTNAEIDGLEAALDLAERFKDLAESLKENLRGLFTGPNSTLTGIEKLNFLQGEVAAAAQRLASATTQEDKLAGIEGLQDLQNQLIDLGSSAFGTVSPEFQALFRETADQLQALVDQANKEGLKADKPSGQDNKAPGQA